MQCGDCPAVTNASPLPASIGSVTGPRREDNRDPSVAGFAEAGRSARHSAPRRLAVFW